MDLFNRLCREPGCQEPSIDSDHHCKLHSQTAEARKRRNEVVATLGKDNPELLDCLCQHEVDGLTCLMPAEGDGRRCPSHGGAPYTAETAAAQPNSAQGLFGDTDPAATARIRRAVDSLLDPFSSGRFEVNQELLKQGHEQRRQRDQERDVYAQRAQERRQHEREQIRQHHRLMREDRLRAQIEADAQVFKLKISAKLSTREAILAFTERLLRLFAAGQIAQRRYDAMMRSLKFMDRLLDKLERKYQDDADLETAVEVQIGALDEELSGQAQGGAGQRMASDADVPDPQPSPQRNSRAKDQRETGSGSAPKRAPLAPNEGEKKAKETAQDPVDSAKSPDPRAQNFAPRKLPGSPHEEDSRVSGVTPRR